MRLTNISFFFFILEVTLYKGLQLGMRIYHKIERGGRIFTFPITTTNVKKNNLLVFEASECQVET
jgi:hypothetical protein